MAVVAVAAAAVVVAAAPVAIIVGGVGAALRCSGQRRHAGAPASASPDGPTGSVAPTVCARVFKERRDELRARSSYIYI